MTVLNIERLAEVSTQSAAFLGRKPFPWAGLQGMLDGDAFTLG